MERELEFLAHCKERIRERGIDEELVKRTVFDPEQIIRREKRTIFHRRYKDETKNKEYLLRVFVKEIEGKIEVESVYRTSKIQKYWREEK